MYRVSSFVPRFALALTAGAGLATLWVNLAPAQYYDAVERRLLSLPLLPDTARITPISVISELGMALFFFVIAKELWEAHLLERGALHGARARLPFLASLGAMAGGALVWLGLAGLMGLGGEAAAGWVVPVGSDVVLGYVVGRLVFGRRHPALHLLLLIATGCDIAGLLAYGGLLPEGALRPAWLALPVIAAGAVWMLAGRHATDAQETGRQRAGHLWPYVMAGCVSWVGVALSGLPGALGLLPVLPAIPHAARSFGVFAEAEELLHDPLNRIAHLLVWPLTAVLFLFGLTRGGVDLGAFGPVTTVTLLAFWVGKPLGLLAGVHLARRLFGIALPEGLRPADLLRIAVILGMGFTVPVLALDAMLPGGEMAEAARLGTALSLLAGPFLLLITGRRGV